MASDGLAPVPQRGSGCSVGIHVRLSEAGVESVTAEVAVEHPPLDALRHSL